MNPYFPANEFVEEHARCMPAELRAAPTIQRFPVFALRVVLRHCAENMRAAEEDRIFDGRRYNRVRALRETCLPGGARSGFYHPHEEFVGQGYWRGPYPRG